jgi:hypothetical protein
MASHIRNAAQQRWAEALFAAPFQDGVDAALAKRAPFQRAYRWLAQLEDAGVIQQWVIWAECGDETWSFDLQSPNEPEAPLYIAGPNWDAFVAEARSLDLLPTP